MTKRFLNNVLKRLRNLPGGTDFFRYSLNKGDHFYRKLTRSTKIAHPSTVMLELSAHCNLKCTICPREYGYGEEMDMGLMETKNAKKIIDELVPYADSIGLTGMGETLMYKNIGEIVDYIKHKNKGIVISISTNAVLPKTIEKVKSLINKIDTIQISIDGIDEVYNHIRVGSDFNLFKDNVQQIVDLARNSNTTIMLNMVVTKENYYHMAEVALFAKKVGVKYVNLTIFNLACITGVDIDYYDFYQSESFRSEIERLNANIQGLEITWDGLGNKNGFQTCTLPWSHFYICWNGEVAPCCAKPFPKELSFGNVVNEGVMNVLNGDSFRGFRTKWLKNETPDFCKKCHFIDCKSINVQ